jgi:hypothetical protein
MTDVLDLIDDTLTDWHTSRDAMHWTANPPEPVDTSGWTEASERFTANVRAAATSLRDMQALCVGDRIDYTWLTDDEREALHAWVLAHGIKLHQVPLDGMIELDDSIPVPEWRVEVYALHNGRPYLANRVADEAEVVRRVVRRVSRGPLPWPTFTAAPEPQS